MSSTTIAVHDVIIGNQIECQVAELLRENARLKKELVEMSEAMTIVPHQSELTQLRRLYKDLMINLVGSLHGYLGNIRKSVVNGGECIYDVIFSGSSIPFIFGETDIEPNDIDAYLSVAFNSSYGEIINAFKNSLHTHYLFTFLRDNIGFEIIPGWELIGIKNITMTDDTNVRQIHLKDILHWDLAIRSLETRKSIKISIMSTYPMIDGEPAFDFAHANDCYSPFIGRMSLTLMSRIFERKIFDEIDDCHMNSLVSHTTKKAWWYENTLIAYVKSLPRCRADEILDIQMLFPIPVEFHGNYIQWMNNFIAIIYFFMRAKIVDKGYELINGVPLKKLEEESDITRESIGTFSVKVCANNHYLTFAEIILHIKGCQSPCKRKITCPKCRSQMFIPDMTKETITIEDAIKQTWTGFANPWTYEPDYEYGDFSGVIVKHNFGDVLTAINEFLDSSGDKTSRRIRHISS